MSGEVDTDQVFLFVEAFNRVPARNLRQVGMTHFYCCLQIIEERESVVLFVRLPFIAVVHQQVETRLAFVVRTEELLAVDIVEALESACLGEVLDRLTVAGLQVDALQEIEDSFVFSVLLPFGDDGFSSTFTDTLDATQTKADSAVLVHDEVQFGFIHIGF